jgi:hypothetical protein
LLRSKNGKQNVMVAQMTFVHKKRTRVRVDALLYWAMLFFCLSFLAAYAVMT